MIKKEDLPKEVGNWKLTSDNSSVYFNKNMTSLKAAVNINNSTLTFGISSPAGAVIKKVTVNNISELEKALKDFKK